MNPFRIPLLLLGWAALAGCQVSDRQVISQAHDFDAALQPAVVRDAELNNYLNAVGERIINAARKVHDEKTGPKAHFADDANWMFSTRMKFHFVNSQTLNAFTTGGEHMYIYTKLFQTCEKEEDLAAVMAHEFAHVYSRHVQKGTQRNYAVLGAALAAGAAGYLAGGEEHGKEYAGAGAGAVAVAGNLVGMNYTRNDEGEADAYGQIFYTRAGWDPRHFGDFFRIMEKQEKTSGRSPGLKWLSDHPPLDERYQEADKDARKLASQYDRYRRPPVANVEQFRALQKRSAAVGRNMPDDKSLQNASTLLQALPRSCLTPVVHDDQVAAQKRLETMLADRKRSK